MNHWLKSTSQIWRDEDGYIHRDNDLPAVIHANGTQEWFQHGKLHRDNGLPAMIDFKGNKYWFDHNLLIRTEESNEPLA